MMEFFRIEELTKVLEFCNLRFSKNPTIYRLDTLHLYLRYAEFISEKITQKDYFVNVWFIHHYDLLYSLHFVNIYNYNVQTVVNVDIKYFHKKFDSKTNLTQINSFIDDYIMSTFLFDDNLFITVNDYDLIEY